MLHSLFSVKKSHGDCFLEKFENTALCLQLGLPSTLIRHEKELCENAFQTEGIWKRLLCVLVWTENNKALRKRWRHRLQG